MFFKHCNVFQFFYNKHALFTSNTKIFIYKKETIYIVQKPKHVKKQKGSDRNSKWQQKKGTGKTEKSKK